MHIKKKSVDSFLREYLDFDPERNCGMPDLNGKIIPKSKIDFDSRKLVIESYGRTELGSQILVSTTYELKEYDDVSFILKEDHKEIIEDNEQD